jgi:hypothetical protein
MECNGGSDDYCLSVRTVHSLLILREMTGRPGIAKAKWLGLQPRKAVAEGSGIVFDRIEMI